MMGCGYRGRSSTVQLENTFYRFVLSSVAGYLLGTSFLMRNPDILQTTCQIISGNFRIISVLPTSPVTTQAAVVQDQGPTRSNIYIGMMSAEKLLPERMLTAAETWMREEGIYVEVIAANREGTIAPGQVRRLNASGIHIVELPGVDDRVYPPQKKSFSLLQRMYDHHIDDFEWFLRLDDDSYLNFDNLRRFLNRINSSEPLQIGHPGFGKNADDYLRNGENYCMGGPGVIFSRKLLLKVRPHLVTCLDRLYTEHEDIEIGRCVNHVTGVSCTLAWDTRLYFYQNYQGGTYASNIKSLAPKNIESGLVFHANKDPQYQYHMRAEILKRRIGKLLNRISDLERDMRGRQNVDVRNYVGENGIVPLKWSNIQRSWHYKSNEQVVARTAKSLKDIVDKNFNRFIYKNPLIHRYEGSHKDSRLSASYIVVNPLKSMDIVSQVELSYDVLTSKGFVRPEVHHLAFHQRFRFAASSVFMREPFTLPASIVSGDAAVAAAAAAAGEVAVAAEEKRVIGYDRTLTTAGDVVVNFILALSGRADNFVRFLYNFENTFLTRGERVNLVVSYFGDPVLATQQKSPREAKAGAGGGGDEDELTKNDPAVPFDVEAAQRAISDQQFILDRIASLQNVYPDNVIKVKLMEAGMEFSRGAGLQRAADEIVNGDEIVFFCDVDLVFSHEILTHIRRNTLQGRAVYFPVFFSQYDPEVVYAQRQKPASSFHFDELDGFWRYFSYGMVSLYKSDFAATSGFDLTIRGWGLEDLHLANAILASGLDVFKSNELGQVHIYHDKSCDPKVLRTKQLYDCRNSRAAHFAPKTLLYYLWSNPSRGTTAATTSSNT